MENKCVKDRALTRMFTRTIITLLVLSFLIGVSAAAPTIYFGEDANQGDPYYERLVTHPNADNARNNFMAQLNGVETENLEDFASGALAPLTADFGAAGKATLTGDGYIVSLASGTNGIGQYPISGKNFWEAYTSSNSFSLHFEKSQVAFGFYGIDIGDINGQLTVTYADGSSQTLTVPHSLPPVNRGGEYFIMDLLIKTILLLV